MPELPEVENVARALRLNLQGRRLTGLKVRFGGVLSQSPRLTRQTLLGKRLDRVYRHGKYLLLTFSAGENGAERSPTPRQLVGDSLAADSSGRYHAGETAHLMIHLRMTGQIFILEDYRPDKHVHLVFDFEGLPVHYRDIRKFGRFTLVEDDRAPDAIRHIGPDMLEIGFAAWFDRLVERRAPIKSLLLDQGIAAGLGNIYVDEALFRAGVHPLTSPADLSRDELKALFRAAKSVLRLAIRHGGTTFLNFTNFHGQPGNFRRKLRVYQRTGEPCPRCGTEIARAVVAGRSSHYCPSCQREA
jgi:formamidopyrimidine-DNA glycosylase